MYHSKEVGLQRKNDPELFAILHFQWNSRGESPNTSSTCVSRRHYGFLLSDPRLLIFNIMIVLLQSLRILQPSFTSLERGLHAKHNIRDDNNIIGNPVVEFNTHLPADFDSEYSDFPVLRWYLGHQSDQVLQNLLQQYWLPQSFPVVRKTKTKTKTKQNLPSLLHWLVCFFVSLLVSLFLCQ